MKLVKNENWQTETRGSDNSEYQLYLDFADDGKGGDDTNGGKPLKSYVEWLNS